MTIANLYDYLREDYDLHNRVGNRGDHRLQIYKENDDGSFEFRVHPWGRDGRYPMCLVKPTGEVTVIEPDDEDETEAEYPDEDEE